MAENKEKGELKHYGTLGMRWGVKRARNGAAVSAREAGWFRKHNFPNVARTLQKHSKAMTKKANRIQKKMDEAEAKKQAFRRMKAKEKADVILGKEIGLEKLSDLKKMGREKAVKYVGTVALATYGAWKLGEFIGSKMYGG